MHYYDKNVAASYFEQTFTEINKIGAGSFGDVYSAVSLEDGNRYAVKIASERYRGRRDREEKHREVHRMEQLRGHPNIVALYAAWEESGHLYIQFELCNESLESYMLNRGPLPEQQVWEFTVDLLNGLKYIHDNQLVHLDVKPANIFVTDREILKLGDFGITIQTNNDKSTGEGDSKYLAMESLEDIFGFFTDIFSLGLTILEMASNLDLPSTGEKWQTLRTGLDQSVLDEIMPDSSASLKTMVQTMMQSDYSKRPCANLLLTSPFMRNIVFQRNMHVQFFYTLYRTKRNVSSKICQLIRRLLRCKRPRDVTRRPEEAGEPATPSKMARPDENGWTNGQAIAASPLLNGSYTPMMSSSPRTPTRPPRYLPAGLSPPETSRRSALRRTNPQCDLAMSNFARRLNLSEDE